MTDNITDSFNRGLMDFIQRSPSPFHAAGQIAEQLQAAGFSRLHEGDAWDLRPGGRYYVMRNQSSIIGFIYGTRPLLETGIRLLGAHTDSPCLKLKPRAEVNQKGYRQLAVEVYGGVLLNTWFDRDLSVAGRVSFRDDQNQLHSKLVNFQSPVAVVPSLAIHLDREANRNRSINAEDDIKPLLMRCDAADNDSWEAQVRAQLEREFPQQTIAQILDSELCLYDTQPPQIVGARGDFIASSRLDNLLSCYVGTRALCEADNQVSSLLVCNDHEEVGSSSACGAKGPMLEHFLQRLIKDTEERLRVLDRSLLISADNAHGVHPNFASRHEAGHGPLLNGGPVIKVNANQRYATNSESGALFRLLCQQAEVPVQSFVSRADMECGSTIGPITATEVGVKTLDVGVPTFAMHSIRELAGSRDTCYLHRVVAAYFARPEAPGLFYR